jgi:hypothetical protein
MERKEVTPMGLPEVSTVLWRERELLEMLLFKLHVEQVMLSSAGSRWLPQATGEVEIVIAEIRQAELARAVAVQALGAELGLGPAPSLAELINACPQPWGDIFAEHRAAFLALTSEISDLAGANREALLAGQRATRETLLGLRDSVSTYDHTGRADAGADTSSRLVDRAL